MGNNSVTIFSNGIASFTRTYAVRKKDTTPLGIPVRKAHISDVLKSLNVFGNVKLLEPPSFTPVNANQSTLKIDTAKVLDSLLTQLSGTNVTVTDNNDKTFVGVLIGKQKSEQNTGNYKVTVEHVLVQTSSGVRAIDLQDVRTVDFTDDDIKAEIAKALQTNRQSIKPDSTFVNLKLQAIESDTDAVLQYNIPTAAWQINYRLSQKDGKFSLEAFAVVHNNTDEDWNNFLVSVVTGEPLTFSSDLQEQKIPARPHVSFVKATTEGGFTAEVGMRAQADDDDGGFESAGGSRGVRSRGIGAAPKAAMMSFGASMPCAAPMPQKAQATLTDAAEVGDFTLWTSKDAISIPAQKSALVPLFDVVLSDAKTVLYYKATRNATRPFRAVKMKNTTGWALGYGPCAVYNNNMSEGDCALDACKPGEERLLLHAKETGVLVKQDIKAREDKLTSTKLSNGIATSEWVYTSVTTYTIKNSKKETFVLELDHENQIPGAEVKSSIPVSESLSDGVRLKIELKPDAQVTVPVTETYVNATEMAFDGNWLRRSSFIDTQNPRKTDPQVLEVVKLQNEVDRLQQEERVAQNRVATLTGEQGRIRENLKAFGEKSEEAGGMRKNLIAAETEIKSLNDTGIPDLQKQREAVQKKLDVEKKKLTVTWTA
jgi:hypothetical protein